MYCSSGGRVDCTNACFTSPFFRTQRFFTASAVRKQSSTRDITGAYTLLFVQWLGSKFPRATIRYFALLGWPSLSYLMVEMAIAGRSFVLGVLNFKYSCSEMHCHAGRLARPSNSLA